MFTIKRIKHRNRVEFAIQTDDEIYARNFLTDAAHQYATKRGIAIKSLSDLIPVLPGRKREGYALVLTEDVPVGDRLGADQLSQKEAL